MSTETLVAEARAALAVEGEPNVLSWLVWALGDSRSREVLPDLRVLASHPSAEVRFPVPDALSMCAEGVFDLVAEALLELSRDVDDDVRWSAIFELAAWRVDTTDDRIQVRLSESAVTDDVPANREVALEGLSEDPSPGS